MSTPSKPEPASAPAAVPVPPPASAPAGDPVKVATPPAAPATTPPAQPVPAAPAVTPPAVVPAAGDPPPAPVKKEGDPEPAKSTAGAPEAYAEFAIPSGMKPDADLNTAFSGIAKELNLSQEAAQKLVSFYGEKVVEKVTRDMTAAWTATSEKWKADILADPDYGGEKFVPNYAKAHRTVQTFGNEEFIKFLDETKLGDHPAFFRFCMKVAEGMGEDKLVQPGETGAAKVPAWVGLYPTMAPKT